MHKMWWIVTIVLLFLVCWVVAFLFSYKIVISSESKDKVEECYKEIDECNNYKYDDVRWEKDWVVKKCFNCCDIHWNRSFKSSTLFCAYRP